jgi:fucose permease
VLGAVGLIVYALSPIIFPSAIYIGIVIGTVIFSASSGLAEVLLSPVIAAIPAKNPDREMSKLHSIYGWSVVGVIILSTVFLYIFGGTYWQWLPVVFSLVPIISSVLFSRCEIPPMHTPEKISGTVTFLKNPTLWICVIAIFLGGAAECTMAQWCSGYVEKALGIKKIWGDIFGTALFGLSLAFGRSLYAKIGKNISKWLFYGGIGATTCYVIAAVSPFSVIALVACAATGFFVAMMWPGMLVVAEKFIPTGGVFVFAMMASGGDLGASVAPQLVGLVTDFIIDLPSAANFADMLGISAEQLGMKFGLLIGALFPLVAIAFYAKIHKIYKK